MLNFPEGKIVLELTEQEYGHLAYLLGMGAATVRKLDDAGKFGLFTYEQMKKTIHKICYETPHKGVPVDETIEHLKEILNEKRQT